MHALFGSGDAERLFRIGRYRDLVGRAASDVLTGPPADLAAELDWPALYEVVDPEGPLVPARVKGRLHAAGATPRRVDLAVAVNGTIEAVTRSSAFEAGTARFSAMVPERALRRGANRIEVLLVTTSPGGVTVRATRGAAGVTYALLPAGEGGLRIAVSDGRTMPVVPGALAGGADGTRQRVDGMALVGWAADLEHGRPADTVLVFVDSEFRFATRTGTNRPDVARRYGNPDLARAGFHVHLPSILFRDIRHADVRVFALSRQGVASELPVIGAAPRGTGSR